MSSPKSYTLCCPPFLRAFWKKNPVIFPKTNHKTAAEENSNCVFLILPDLNPLTAGAALFLNLCCCLLTSHVLELFLLFLFQWMLIGIRKHMLVFFFFFTPLFLKNRENWCVYKIKGKKRRENYKMHFFLFKYLLP